MAALLSLTAFRITFRVAEPAAWARHLRLCSSANAVTGQGLGEVSAANEAGNPVLGEGAFFTQAKSIYLPAIGTNTDEKYPLLIPIARLGAITPRYGGSPSSPSHIS